MQLGAHMAATKATVSNKQAKTSKLTHTLNDHKVHVRVALSIYLVRTNTFGRGVVPWLDVDGLMLYAMSAAYTT